MSAFKGRVGVVLGVSTEQSIGFACVEKLHAEGAELIVTRRGPDSDPVVDRLRALGVQIVRWDATAAGGAATVAAAIAKRWGRLDFAVHTLMQVPASILARPMLELQRSELDQVLHIGVHSLIEFCRESRALLAGGTQPRVVALSSENSRRASANYHVAGICKGALESAVRYLALELGEHAVCCNCVSAAPLSTSGAVETVGAELIAKTRSHLAKRALVRRAPELSDVADAVAFLVSPQSGGISGEVLVVDGGFSRRYM